ncbi:avidin/streptavidin family protein [Sphingomonas sp. Leaf208]|uniref:avidin/streptavidin family protein n=1 Tax=Sphingomonas sp. Leaf208 TaxID=1735679 RepID=UPI0009EAE00C|nr:avidin/streptavidin family protein [Sphingomonas sp. Leaf208]
MNAFVGNGVNELGSELDIVRAVPLSLPSTTLEHLQIDGTYRTRVGVENNGEFFPMVGFVTGNLISFCVSYNRIDEDGEHRSTCTWAGQYLPDQRPNGTFDPNDSRTSIRTLWHLVPNLTDPSRAAEYGWLLAHSGGNAFTKRH